MKRKISLFLALIMVFSLLTACDAPQNQNSELPPPPSNEGNQNGFVNTPQMGSNSGTERWEYLLLDYFYHQNNQDFSITSGYYRLNGNSENFIKGINELGEAGWELITTSRLDRGIAGAYTFKRRLP